MAKAGRARSASAVAPRVTIAAVVVVLIWLGVAGVGGQLVGSLSQLQKNDTASFLPESAESTRVAETVRQLQDRTTLPLLVVVERSGGLTPADLAAGQAFAQSLPGRALALDGATTIADYLTSARVAAVPSKDGAAMLVALPLDTEAVTTYVGKEQPLRVITQAVRDAAAADLAPSGLTAYATGPGGFVADLTKAFGGIDGILLFVALGVVLVILLVVYRSPVLPFAVLLTSVFGLAAAGFVVYRVAEAGLITVSGQSQGILSILVVGAATDYALLLVSRYREELHDEPSTWAAMRRAWRATVEPILASALTVALGLLALSLADLKGTSGLGPVAALGILGALFSALTFLPAVLVLGRRWIFWPSIPRVDHIHRPDALSARLGWGWVARTVGARPRTVWVTTVVCLLAAAAFLPTLKSSGIAQSDIFLRSVESVEGQRVLARHFDAGSGSPVQVLVPQGKVEAAIDRLRSEPGVSDPYAGLAPGAPAPARDGLVLVQATLAQAADSPAAVDTVERVRNDLRALDERILVGGQTAQSLDTRLAADRDLRVVVPAIVAVVFLILALLLRALVAPLLLVVVNLLSFAATMGVSALVFNYLFKFPGGDPTTLLYGFVFLVALGVDYSIFLMTRAREEVGSAGPRQGVLKALTVTGGVITSAGIVLAATFGALTVIPLVFLAQIAFIVAFGVLVDTLVVRSLLVPAVAVELGRWTWWPSRLSRADTPAPSLDAAPAVAP